MIIFKHAFFCMPVCPCVYLYSDTYNILRTQGHIKFVLMPKCLYFKSKEFLGLLVSELVVKKNERNYKKSNRNMGSFERL